jgi:ferredoxin
MSDHDRGSQPVMGWPFVDREICMGSGQCTVYAPNSFRLDADLKAQVSDPTGDPRDVIGHAVQACPTGALRLGTYE